MDWLIQMDEFFDSYQIDNYQRITFAKMKLIDHVRICWNNILAKEEILGKIALT